MDQETLNRYQSMDVNVYQENIFHTKMMAKDFRLSDYLFGISESSPAEERKHELGESIKTEMFEIFHGTNIKKPDKRFF